MVADPVIDREELLDRLGGDAELVREILELFEEESDRMFTAVAEAFAATDSNALERSAHTLKGALLNIAATRAAGVASNLERIGREGTLDAAAPHVARLREELDLLLHRLQAVPV